MNKTTEWLTASELAELTGVPTEILGRGVDAGLFKDLVATVAGEQRFAPDTIQFVAWSSQLFADVAAGAVTMADAHRLLWARARQLRRRLARTLVS